MRLTKLRHACVRLEKDGAALVIDPGVFSRPDALAVADAVLITHEHVDHVDDEVLRTAMTGNPGLELWTNGSVASQYADFGGRVHTVAHGDVFQAAGFDVHVYGQKHAEIHRDIPIVENTGFLVDGEVFHPGDALTVPEDPVRTLLLPGNAPWLLLADAGVAQPSSAPPGSPAGWRGRCHTSSTRYCCCRRWRWHGCCGSRPATRPGSRCPR